MVPVLSLDDFLRPGEAFHLQSDLRTRRWGVASHTHRFAEVFWIFEGGGRHHVNGQTIDLGCGAVVFIRPGDVHSVETLPHQAMGFTNLAFSSEHLRAIRRRYCSEGAWWPWADGDLPQVRKLEPAQLAPLHAWSESLDSAPHSVFELDRLLLNLWHLVDPGLGNEPADHAVPDWLLRACRGIRQRAAMQEGVPAFVRLCGRGPEHVSRTVRLRLGMSPTEYVNQIRLQYLERQLRTSSTSILDLILSAGFTSVGHVYEQFKTRYGMPPHRYRQAHQNHLV